MSIRRIHWPPKQPWDVSLCPCFSGQSCPLTRGLSATEWAVLIFSWSENLKKVKKVFEPTQSGQAPAAAGDSLHGINLLARLFDLVTVFSANQLGRPHTNTVWPGSSHFPSWQGYKFLHSQKWDRPASLTRIKLDWSYLIRSMHAVCWRSKFEI